MRTGKGLNIDYRNTAIEELASESGFDLVTSLEVIEHVDDPEGFVAGLVQAMADDGLTDPFYPESHRQVQVACWSNLPR